MKLKPYEFWFSVPQIVDFSYGVPQVVFTSMKSTVYSER